MVKTLKYQLLLQQFRKNRKKVIETKKITSVQRGR